MPKEFFHRDTCRVCDSLNIHKSLELEPSPPGNNFIKQNQLDSIEQVFPLELFFCDDCHHIQLGHVVDPTFLFQNNYSYVSATSSVFVDHLKEYANHVSEMLKLDSSSFVMDIGSNDGTCLSFFKEKGLNVLGVDPATEIAIEASKNGIETIADFFSNNLAISILEKYGSVDLITSHNACAHIDDLTSVIEGVGTLLKPTGVFIMEVGYFVDVFQNKWFDTIYHEHVDFHTVGPLKILFKRFGMEIFNVERISPQGGSIRVMVQREGAGRLIEESVENLVKLEESIGLNNRKALSDFEDNINLLRIEFKTLIRDLKSKGKSIAAFGAPTKATTLCHHFDINSSDIDFIVDDNPLKQGLYSPGKHIPVYPPEKIYQDKPDYLLILAWNFASPIMRNHRDYEKQIGSFILPMPSPEVIQRLSTKE